MDMIAPELVFDHMQKVYSHGCKLPGVAPDETLPFLPLLLIVVTKQSSRKVKKEDWAMGWEGHTWVADRKVSLSQFTYGY